MARPGDAYQRAQRWWLLRIVIVMSAGLGLLLPVPTAACAPTATTSATAVPTPGVQAYTEQADIIVEGTVTAIREIHRIGDSRVATIQVRRYLKGNGPATIHIDGFGYGPDCRAPIEVGITALFYAEGNPNEQLASLQLETFHAYDAVDTVIVDQIRQQTNQAPRDIVWGASLYDTWRLHWGWIATLLVVGSGVAVGWWLRATKNHQR